MKIYFAEEKGGWFSQSFPMEAELSNETCEDHAVNLQPLAIALKAKGEADRPGTKIIGVQFHHVAFSYIYEHADGFTGP